MMDATTPAEDLRAFVADRRVPTILADPPWRFQNRTGKVAPEHQRLMRYGTMALDEIMALHHGAAGRRARGKPRASLPLGAERAAR